MAHPRRRYANEKDVDDIVTFLKQHKAMDQGRSRMSNGALPRRRFGHHGLPRASWVRPPALGRVVRLLIIPLAGLGVGLF